MAYRCLSCMATVEDKFCPYCGYPAAGKNDEHQLSVGTVIRDRYQIGKVLGQGGFGITYLAWDLLMRRPVAVKEFFPGGMVYRTSSASSRVECVNSTVMPHYQYSKERFLREARALVDFRDLPEVVEIYDFLEENNTAYIVMEYIKGVDLAKYIERRGGTLSVEETFRILKPIMETLAKVHRHGIVHRDISPDNIMLDPKGGAKLLDFGAVRIVEDPAVDKALNSSTEAILKRGFAPLEQYNNRGGLGPWTDEYAMCATVWYCLTGEIPADATIRVMESIDLDWSSIPGLPEHQQRALRKGVSCRAKDRYMTMDQLLEDLFPADLSQKGAQVSGYQQGAKDTKSAISENRMPVGYDTVLPESERKQSKKKHPMNLLGGFVAVLIVVLAVFAVIKWDDLWHDRGIRASDAGHKHQWEPASCIEPEHCSDCGKTKGSPLGHAWSDATCTEAQKCSVCGATGEPALDHQWLPATEDSPMCCSTCGKYEGRSLGKPLVNYRDSICGHSEKDGLDDNDILEGSFSDLTGNMYDDALCFWVSTWLDNSYEYIEYMSPDFAREGLGIQIEYSIALTKINGTWFNDDELSAYVDVYMDGARIGGTGVISGTEIKQGILEVPAGSVLKIYCNTTATAWTDCIFQATVYYVALPESESVASDIG